MHKDNMLVQFFKRSLQNDGKERGSYDRIFGWNWDNEKTI